MVKYLLPKGKNFYKANLHCHSTVSDGRFTPKELKKMYKEKGYSIIAYTDHEILVDHSNLNDSEFLALTGYEVSINEDNPDKKPYNYLKTYHFNLFAKKADNVKHVHFNPKYIWFNKNEVDLNSLPYVGELAERKFCPSYVNKFIKDANENGFLVCFNHPLWNIHQSSEEYLPFEGLWAMEIFNTGAEMEDCGYAPYEYKRFIMAGKDIACVAADDNHGKGGMFGGFVMIAADELKYESIISALEKKEFYSSTGVLLEEIYLEDDKLTVKCSPSCSVYVKTENRQVYKVREKEDIITSAEFLLNKEKQEKFWVFIKNTKGEIAVSNAYSF